MKNKDIYFLQKTVEYRDIKGDYKVCFNCNKKIYFQDFRNIHTQRITKNAPAWKYLKYCSDKCYEEYIKNTKVKYRDCSNLILTEEYKDEEGKIYKQCFYCKKKIYKEEYIKKCLEKNLKYQSIKISWQYRKYCSKECSIKNSIKNQLGNLKLCENCNKPIEKIKNKHFCSHKCQYEYKRKKFLIKIVGSCLKCGKGINKKNKRFCSRECYISYTFETI